jgi:hypothetical protein
MMDVSAIARARFGMNAPERHAEGWARTVENLAAMPAFLEAALHEAGGENLRARPSAEDFSLVEHACHLRDLEREGYLVRVRRILSEDCPRLDGFDGKSLAAARDYPSQDAQRAAQDFAAARRELLALLAMLDPTDFSRAAAFDGERITLARLVAMIDAHDSGHRAEIERILDDIEE